MQFSATVRPKSVPYRNWKSIGRLGGHIEGVKFTWNGHAFVADNLTQHQVELLRPLPSVELHCAAIPLDEKALAAQYGFESSEPVSSSPVELPAPAGGGRSAVEGQDAPLQVPVPAPAQAFSPGPVRVPPPLTPPPLVQPPLRLPPKDYGKVRGKPVRR